MKFLRRTLIIGTDVLLCFLLGFILVKTELSAYLISQAKGQLKIIQNSREIKDLIAENKFTEEDLEKLQLIEEVKKFATDSLQYTPSDNYTTYYDQQGKPLLWIVTGSDAFNLSAMEWSFPWLGRVSYKGYFDSTRALRQQGELLMKNYDADINRVNAWSTLGWFRDPVFSEMLKKTKGDLAELIFHELFHGTIYAPNSVDLNENLANFISWKATQQFLSGDTAALAEYLSDYEKDRRYDEFVLNCSAKLDSAYAKMKEMKLSARERKKIKTKMIVSFISQLRKEKLYSEKTLKRIEKKFMRSGNSYFMHFKRYDSMRDSLENVLNTKYGGDLGRMVNGLKTEIESL